MGDKKIFFTTNEPMLSAKIAAKRLGFAKDYIGKLCRAGKLKGERIAGACYVSERSIAEFEVLSARAKVERSEGLSEQRRLENQIYKEVHGITPAIKKNHTLTGLFENFFLTIPSAKHIGLSFGALLLFASLAFAGASSPAFNV